MSIRGEGQGSGAKTRASSSLNVARHPYPANLPGLTSLRFFAAIWVVAFHFVWWLTPPGVPKLEIPVVVEGNLAPDFFFILSGFILTHAHFRQVQTSALDTKEFLIKRLARIYPLHLAMLLFYLVLIAALRFDRISLPNPERYNAVQFLLNIFLVQAWQTRIVSGWNFPSWSISAEWFAYLLFPVLSTFLVSGLTWIRAELLVAVTAAALIACCAIAPTMLGGRFFDLSSNFGYFRILPEFILGIALYRLGTERRIPALESRWAVVISICLILLFAIWQLDLLCVLSVSLLILAVAETARQKRRDLLAKASMVYLGEVSYSIYMIHIPLATVLLGGMTMAFGSISVWVLPPAVVATVVLAGATHRLIEVPGRTAILWAARKHKSGH